MNPHVLYRNLLLIALPLYFSQGGILDVGSLFPKIILVLSLIISIYYFFLILSTKILKNKFYKVWTFFIILNILSFVFSGNYAFISLMRSIFLTFIVFYPFYYFSHIGILKPKHLIIFLLLMLPVTILNFVFNKQAILSERISDRETVVNNVSYVFVGLLPFIFLFKKKIYGVLVALLMFFFIIQGAKRGALAAAGLVFIMYIFYWLRTIKSNKFRNYSISLIGLSVLMYYGYESIIKNEFLIDRINDMLSGNSSGRDVIYSKTFNWWLGSDSYIELIFGGGFANSVTVSGGSYAHNDWLELLVDQGLIGVIAYLLLFIYGFFAFRKLKWTNSNKFLLITILSVWFLISLYSIWYPAINTFTYSILIGYIFGSREEEVV